MISDTRMPTASDARVAEIQLLLHCECVDWLTSQPTAHSREQQCFENVAQHIQKHQGIAQLGYNVCVCLPTPLVGRPSNTVYGGMHKNF